MGISTAFRVALIVVCVSTSAIAQMRVGTRGSARFPGSTRVPSRIAVENQLRALRSMGVGQRFGVNPIISDCDIGAVRREMELSRVAAERARALASEFGSHQFSTYDLERVIREGLREEVEVREVSRFYRKVFGTSLRDLPSLHNSGIRLSGETEPIYGRIESEPPEQDERRSQ